MQRHTELADEELAELVWRHEPVVSRREVVKKLAQRSVCAVRFAKLALNRARDAAQMVVAERDEVDELGVRDLAVVVEVDLLDEKLFVALVQVELARHHVDDVEQPRQRGAKRRAGDGHDAVRAGRAKLQADLRQRVRFRRRVAADVAERIPDDLHLALGGVAAAAQRRAERGAR